MLAVLIAVGGEMLGDVLVRAQAHGASVQQGKDQAAPLALAGRERGDLAALQGEGLGEKLAGDSLPGIAVGTAGGGGQSRGEPGIERVGAAGPGIRRRRIQGVVGIDALEEEVPEGDQRRKEALVKGPGSEGGELVELGPAEELKEENQELGWGKARAGRGWFWGRGVFLDRRLYAYRVICILCDILTFVKPKNIRSAVSERQLQKLLTLWPALKGSLAQVRKPCIRPHCPACARGEKHPNHLLAFSRKGRRRCMYVPLAMVPALEHALENGRRIEQLLYDMGPALLREYRAQNPAQTGPSTRLARPQTKKSRTKS